MAKGKRHGLYQREGGIWAFRFKDGDRWREKYTGETSFGEAREVKTAFEQRLKTNTLPTDKARMTVEQAATIWVHQHAANLGSDKGRANERSLLTQLIRRLGPRRLSSIVLDDLKNYQVLRRGQVSARIVNLELRILVNVLKEANLWQPIAEHYEPLREKTSDLGKALTIADLNRLEATAAARPTWYVAYYVQVLSSHTGLRGGEVKRLQLRDVDLDLRRLTIRNAKTDAGCRLVELNQAATAAVVRLHERALTLGASKPEHYLLPCDLSRHTKATDPLKGGRGFDVTGHQKSWQTAWRRLRKAAGFEKLRFHDLRHSFISLMAEKGVPLPVVQSMVGHMSERMTRHYTHISTQAARQAVELLDREPFVGKFVGKRDVELSTDGKSNRKLLN